MKKFIPLALIILAFTACKEDTVDDVEEPIQEVPKIVEEFGFNLNDFKVIRDTVQPGDTFGILMDKEGVSPAKVFQIVNTVKDTFNVSRIRAGKPYTILKSKDSLSEVKAFIYQPSKINYTVIDLQDSIRAYNDKLPISIKRKTASGVITSSLSQAMEEEGLSPALIYELSDVYQWTIDFFKLQKGDNFKLIYNEIYINDSIYAGVKNIEAAVLNHYGEPYYGFRFTTDSIRGLVDYYDEKGNTLRSFFLKAPLNYSRISSRFTKRRFHPVQKRWKAHLGTDYAAPHGTPIMTTANGVVEKSGYTGGNGNYVKVRHNSTYSTQYLHMSRRAVKTGQRVKQGDVIGYVGSTGLATGPHVCYRFWYNGRQVDPYAIKLPAADPIKEGLKQPYFEFIAPLRKEVDAIPEKTL